MRAHSPRFRPLHRRRLSPLLEALAEIGASRGATPAQVALAWVLHHPNTIAIPGARTLEQLEENAAAADLSLADGEFERLSAEAAALATRPES
jgi:aryl-alcohol dehydrogenase-like predicted oxidoreductase